MKKILIGHGEIGQALVEVFGDMAICDIGNQPDGEYDLMLVAVPYDENFVDCIRAYQDRYKVKETIIFSTVPVGTCSQLGAVHSPVEGKHPDLAESIRMTDKWLGGHSNMARELFQDFNIIQLDKPEHTEFLKLQSTTKYGINIEFARYVNDVCNQIGLDYNYAKEWDKWYNKLYSEMGMDWAQKYVLDAPTGPKGGHCVTQNARILQKQFPNAMVNVVAE